MVQWQRKILSIPCSRREAPLATKKYQLECSSSYVRLVFVFEELTQESNQFHLTAQYFSLICLYYVFSDYSNHGSTHQSRLDIVQSGPVRSMDQAVRGPLIIITTFVNLYGLEGLFYIYLALTNFIAKF